MSRAIAITDPLVKYQSLVARGIFQPDPAQHRLAVHLQKLYIRLKDYTPAVEYKSKLQRVTRAIEDAKQDAALDNLATKDHPIRRNPLFARFFAKREGRDSLALTRVLTGREAAINVDSPQGLFLSGDVGTGKSMLLDLLAESLPTKRKKRWHYHTFILHAFSALERHRKAQLSFTGQEPEYSLLWLAKNMVETTPILFLDEFQLPDRAASKLLNNLFLAFFQLGGVLVASSNRMPEELANAAGAQYPQPAGGGLLGQLLVKNQFTGRGELFGQTSDFAVFLDVLKARCDFWHIEGTRDWRKHVEISIPSSSAGASQALDDTAMKLHVEEKTNDAIGGTPAHSDDHPAEYHLIGGGNVQPTLYGTDRIWRPATFVVYGRTLRVPKQCDGCACWDFDELVYAHGPADFLTLASHFHTFIIDRVPILRMSMKNEARRFITLLDALYEARCKLVIRAAAPPDKLFFPEARTRSFAPGSSIACSTSDAPTEGKDRQVDSDAVYSETIAEVFQDQTSPFRPNISSYTSTSSKTDEQDLDSDFGPSAASMPAIDFGNTSAFTGEDERFAYKRAASRLWEMCSARWHAREGDWWQPLPKEARHWEGVDAARPLGSPIRSRADAATARAGSDARMGARVALTDGPVGLERFSLDALRKKFG
jgi:peroxisome-assembly ATPase